MRRLKNSNRINLTKKTTTRLTIALVLAGGVLLGQGLLNRSNTAHAATPQDACSTVVDDFVMPASSGVMVVGYQIGGPNNCPSAVEVPSTIGGKAVAIVGGYNEDNAQKTPFDNVTSLKLP